MGKQIDCILIGYNEMEFEVTEKRLRSMGAESGAYRELNLGFINYQNKPYTAQGVFNLFYNEETDNSGMGPFRPGNMFSAAIAYLGTYLQKHNYSYAFVDSFQQQKNDLKKLLEENEVLSIAITTTLYLEVFPIMEIVSFIKKYNKTAKILVGGPFIRIQARNHDEQSLNNLLKIIGADIYINSHQGENTLINVISALKNQKPLQDISNIYYRDGSPNFVCTDISIENNTLNENFVNWGLFGNYVKKYVPLRTAYSCPFSCAFCSAPKNQGKYQTMDVEIIERELDYLHKIDPYLHLSFIDDTFNFPPERFKSILKMMIKKKYKFTWDCPFRCQYADRETLQMMVESGCKAVFLGIESGSQIMLDNMNKNVKAEQLMEGLKLINEYGLISYASFIIGFPGETMDTVECTRKFIEEYKPTFYHLRLWYCEQHTPIWERGSDFGLKGSNFSWSHNTMDAKAASRIIDDLFKKIRNSIWMPQNGFEYYGVFNMMKRGYSIEKIVNFINAFNHGVSDKLNNQNNGEISETDLLKIKEALDLAKIDG